MKLGDFFTTAPHAQPVNPKPVTFTAIARGSILPGGAQNPNPKGQVRARVTAAFVFICGDETIEARSAARKALRERSCDPAEADSFSIELTYQLLLRILHEWDPVSGETGARMFPDAAALRELVVVGEADRVLADYNAYVDEEHGTPDDATFRDAEGGGPRVAVGASG